MSAHGPRILVLCQAAAAELATKAVRQLHQGALGPSQSNGDECTIDVLTYGRASHRLPPPPGARLVASVFQGGTTPLATIRLLLALTRHRYDFVALSQPALAHSRARGLLVAFSHFVARGHAVIVDPASGRVVGPITTGLATAEVLRWLALRVVARVVAAVATPLLARFKATPAIAHRYRLDGSVIYLRTDIELALAPLIAGGSVAHTNGILQGLLDLGHQVCYWGTGEVDGLPAHLPRRTLPALLKGNLPTEIAEFVSGVAQGLARAKRPTSGPPEAPVAFVYQRYSLNNLAGVILAHRWGVPLVLEANASEAKWRQDFSVLVFPRLARACERLILRRANIVTVVSTNAADDLSASGVPVDRVHVIPNGVSVSRFATADPMPLPSIFRDGFIVAFVGLFYPWHGVRFLAEAFALARERLPDARLLLVGDGEEASLVRAVLESRGALAASHSTGLVSRPEAARYMASADVLVSPHADVHHFIGSPIKLFEYMAAGKPIVATRVGQIEDVLRDDDTALLVPPEDSAAMASAFERLHGDRALGRRLGQAAQAEARAKHSWDARVASILDALYQSATGPGS